MKHREYYNLYMDFDHLRDKGIFPSDLDMVYLCEDNFLVIGEIKYKGNHVAGMQEKVLTSIIDGHLSDGVLMEIEHRTRVQDHDSVDVAGCKVTRAYFNERWHEYSRPLNVLTWMQRLSYMHGGMTRI